MILAIGIDSVEIHRFQSWTTKPHKQLLRIFSEQEIAYCLSCKAKAAERFAARFAAKEAFYKAVHSIMPNHKLPLFTVCAQIEVIALANSSPRLKINWDYFKKIEAQLPNKLEAHISITHTKTTATAIVILESL